MRRAAAAGPVGGGRRPSVPDRDVRLLWWANSSDALGTQISGLALPLLLLGLGYSPALVGVVAGVSTALGLLLGPFAAVPADRGARRRVMILSAAVSAAALGSLAVALAMDSLHPAHLFAAVLAERVATSCQEAATRGAVALVCPADDYPRVVSRLQAGEQGALVLGPLLGGLLYQAARWLPFLADALSYLVAALCVRGMRSDLAPAGAGRRDAPPSRARWAAYASEAGAGLALVLRSPVLRLVLVWTAAAGGLLVTLHYTVVFALQGDGRGPAAVGLVFSVAGAAGLAGALAAPAVLRRLTAPRTLVAVSWLVVPAAAGLAAGSGPWSYGLLFGAVSLLVPAAVVVLQTRALRVTPPELQARTGTALATAAGIAAAVAPLAAGTAVAGAGVVPTIAGCAVLLAVLAAGTTLAVARGILSAPSPGPVATAKGAP
ncbi:MFS transporter [Streptomyces sp. CNQ085]|uniref:MFS transporter n=1 Tax=Streptomyces sp. CNQ085 TaxID=2886944 RepID=UPI001F506483|nr:MFS transporter [Streptomyces sp. CNQ085]MCI0383733.1 MFS transporter [Streptomyces sp. CNQ085]